MQNTMAIQSPVSTWQPAENLYRAGDRRWLVCTEDFYFECLGVMPPEHMCTRPGFGQVFGVGEPWSHTGTGEPILLFLRSQPEYMCRCATWPEIQADFSQEAAR